jgi:hypothetical protein
MQNTIHETSYSKYIHDTNTASKIKERVLWSLHQHRCNDCQARGEFDVAVLGQANVNNPCGISHNGMGPRSVASAACGVAASVPQKQLPIHSHMPADAGSAASQVVFCYFPSLSL